MDLPNGRATPKAISNPALKRRKPQVIRRIDAWKLEAAFCEITGNSKIIEKKDGIALLARYLGLAPSRQEVDTFFQMVNGRCDLATFRRFCSLLVHDEDKAENFRQLFQVYDRDQTGKLKKKVLRMIFCNIGEAFSAEDWRNLEQVFDLAGKSDDDLISYDSLVNKLLDLPG
ncbi:putative myosin light chain MLC4 [Besnoitia besnoiti]|uniref:Putative myosin light chain MLC4 n=1 Tax=Besnoitia besnoiti TaxID=94643 RepID=A0A2A9M8A2_BESBE|nr:putative myosin light chain MLC4 [Besnoitia besnoiti]PFH31610.1 putative myosin light chain MLC4 [Besnoitia besnoiti]